MAEQDGVKDYLSQAQKIDMRINSKLEQLESLNRLAERVTAVAGNDMPHSSPDVHRFEKTLASIADTENTINASIDKLLELKQDIAKTIETVHDPRYKAVLEMKYLNFMTWEKIGEQLGCDPRHARRLLEQALKQVALPEK